MSILAPGSSRRPRRKYSGLAKISFHALLAYEKGWKEFDANGCVIALHNGTSQVGRRPPKIGFWARDIAAARQELIGRGARLSKLMVGGGLVRCEGKDPDGNPFSLSDRE
jgi:hypothetical protein